MKIPLSNNTISRRIAEMSLDIEEQVCQTLQHLSMFALQVDESTDISGKAQLLAFVRMVREGDIAENFPCCKALPGRTTADDTFQCLDQYLESANLSWQKCVL